MLRNNLILIVMLMFSWKIKAQVPSNDSAWVKIDSLSDEFNGNSLNYSVWDTTYCYDWQYGCYNVSTGAEWAFRQNVHLDSIGHLKIKIDTLQPNKVAAWGTFPDNNYGTTGQSLTYAYQGGVANTKRHPYLYGYIEASAKFPSNVYPLWIGFWLVGSATNSLNEIDVAEMGADQIYAGNHVGNNYHTNFVTGSYTDSSHIIDRSNDIVVPINPLSGGYYRFGYECNPSKLTYYFENNATTIVTDTNVVPRDSMQVMLTAGVSPWYAKMPSDWNGTKPTNHTYYPPTHYPQYFMVDYIRYYKLKSNCSLTQSICAPTDYKRDVRKYITTSSSCTVTFNPSDWNHSYVLRATDYVLLDVPTGSNSITINPSGTGYFAIDIMACPN